ncbi:MAG: erythromycin esterase family protein [Paracoccus sp. (in: a-proteobacteria)]|uniref:erythromycin esterase family protein n=1 Tax=Paracoccus sp. TaxID=267 RepID=UPI00405867B1
MYSAISAGLTAGFIGAAVRPLPPTDDAGFAAAFDPWAGRRVLMLGESSHGTDDFYRARACITRHMIQHHGVTIVAVEADWPDAAVLNRHVRGLPQGDAPPPFRRFPRWMWRNRPISELIDWMRDWNRNRPLERQAGFFGLDLYNMTSAMRSVIAYLAEVDPGAAEIAKTRYGCLQPWTERPGAYGRAVLGGRYDACENAVVAQCRDLLNRRAPGPDALDAAQNARLVASAERYYRIMYRGGPDAWNLRDSHMCGTLAHLLDAAGPDGKAVVWAHNSHIGDARYGEMGQVMGEHNLGQLARQRWGDQVALIGFGTHAGTVTAASDWDGPAEVKTVQPSHPDSFEMHCHDSGNTPFLLDMKADPALSEALAAPHLQRFIGVVYRPESELASHYMRTLPSRQYDAWVWFDRSSALAVPALDGAPEDVPDTWPFGT